MENEFLNLLKIAPKERLKDLLERKDLMFRLWAFEKEFSKTFKEALLNFESVNDHYLKQASQYFIDITIANFITKPSDLISVISEFQKQNIACKFLGIYVRHHLSNEDVLLGLGADKNIFKRLPHDIGWPEVPITTYAKMLLKSGGDKLFEVEELLPLGIDASLSTSEYVLGWAYEENRLTDSAIEVFKSSFSKKYEHLNKILKR